MKSVGLPFWEDARVVSDVESGGDDQPYLGARTRSLVRSQDDGLLCPERGRELDVGRAS